MILVLSSRKKPRVDPALKSLGEVRTARVPVETTAPASDGNTSPARPQRPRPDWAYRRLNSLRRLITDNKVSMVVCADQRTHGFALLLAEQHPTIPVLPDQQIAVRILAQLQERGTASSRGAVHDLLDPLRNSLPPVPSYFFDRAIRPPLVVSLVQNAVVGDSRVQKVAESLADAGYESVLLALNPPEEPQGDWFLIGDAAVLRLPVSKDLYYSQKKSPPGPLPARLFGYRSAEQDRAAWHSHQRRLDMLGPQEEPDLRTRLGGRIVEWRSSLYWLNKRSFGNQEHRRKPHERRAARLSAGRTMVDAESAYPLIADVEEVFGPALDALKPHAIHVHDPMLLGIAVRARQRLARLGCDAPIVFDAHEWTPGVKREHAYHAAAMVRLERELLAEAADTVTVSDQIAAKMQQEFRLKRPPTVVENAPKAGVDPEFADVRSDAGVPDDAPLLVYVGGIAERRGVDDLVAAMRHLPDAHLVLVSPSGARMRQLRSRAKELGVNQRVHRLDYVPADKVTSYIRTADVGVIPFRPLLNSELGVPTKFREYLLAGLPMVATDLGATAEAVRRTGVGELCKHTAPKALASAIRKVLANPTAYTSQVTPELLADSSWETQSTKLLEVYERLIGAPPAAAPRSDVLIGATNSAGQAYQWARALRSAGVAAESLELRLPENSFTHRVDLAVPRPAVTGLDRKVQLLLHELAPRTTVVLESGRSIAAPETGDIDTRRQGFREARALRASGRNVGLIFHGSDVRRPDIHLRAHPWSPFNDPRAAALTAELRKRTQVVHEELASWDGPVMVSTPDLIHATPGAIWTPVVIDIEQFPLSVREPAESLGMPPVVVHMPSRSLLKGSHLIDPVLRALAAEGVIQYRRIERVPHDAVPQILADCDIFVDQLGMGIFGVAPLEAMASGAAVVTDPGPEALEVYGEELPVAAVNPDTIAHAVRELAADHQRRAELAVSGREFAIRHHDGRRSAEAMIQALGLPR